MNANLLHLLLAIVFTASITGIHAYRTGDLDRPVNESDTNAGTNAFHSETLCTMFITLKEIYEGNCMNNSSITVGENDVNSAFHQMSFGSHPGQNNVTDNQFQKQRKCSFIYEFFQPHINDCMNNSSIRDRRFESGN
ncbi:hypothetical protein MS3_00000683 [Schistosoma haematobium]|uniref:Uncharacterized protein n=1 Tax=Schistosoma haematobium TaxID=6185 RepID=A0A922IIP5_SCHHA|nr:hypothetical protein MS3_00000683 [Schistosoma haematobium]KAH9580435.1 hypothetical protein MS3_00000683 [Schistosoma haematobium]